MRITKPLENSIAIFLRSSWTLLIKLGWKNFSFYQRFVITCYETFDERNKNSNSLAPFRIQMQAHVGLGAWFIEIRVWNKIYRIKQNGLMY